MGGIDGRIIRQFGRQAVRRGELSAGQLVGARAAEQVRPAGRAVQQRAAGEDRAHLAGGLERVRQVRERVPGRGQHPDPQHRTDLDEIPVTGGHPVEGHLIGPVDVIGRPGRHMQSGGNHQNRFGFQFC